MTSSITMNGPTGVHAVVEDVDHVRMVQRGGGLRLAAGTARGSRVAAVLGAQDLDGDVAPSWCRWAR